MISLALTLVFAPAPTLPVRVDGEGYLRFVRDGRIVYASSATLTVANGCLAAKDLPVTPAIRVPANAVKLDVDLAGNVSVLAAGAKSVVGRLVLAKFDAAPTSENGFLISSRRAAVGNPGEGLFGVIRTTNSSISPTTNSTVPSGSASVTVQPVSEVTADTVTLRDIATISGDPAAKAALESIVIGSAPAIGIDSPVTQVRIASLVKRQGVNAEIQVPAGAVIRRKCQMIGNDDFIAAAIKAAQEKLGVEVPMTCPDVQGDFKAPIGEVVLKGGSVISSGTSLSVVVSVYVDGKDKSYNSRTINLKVDSSQRVLPGAAVKIVMKSAGLTVEVNGKTRTGGMVGQTVSVVTDTGSVLEGVVIGADKIEVKI